MYYPIVYMYMDEADMEMYVCMCSFVQWSNFCVMPADVCVCMCVYCTSRV